MSLRVTRSASLSAAQGLAIRLPITEYAPTGVMVIPYLAIQSSLTVTCALTWGNDGVTANDLCDTDVGANGLQNFPELALLWSGGGATTIRVGLNSGRHYLQDRVLFKRRCSVAVFQRALLCWLALAF